MCVIVLRNVGLFLFFDRNYFMFFKFIWNVIIYVEFVEIDIIKVIVVVFYGSFIENILVYILGIIMSIYGCFIN